LVSRAGLELNSPAGNSQLIDSKKSEKRQSCPFSRTEVHGGYTEVAASAEPPTGPIERSRLSDRVKAGIERARIHGTRSGKPIGRPRALLRRDEVAELRRNGLSWRQIASKVGVGVGTVRRAAVAVSNAV
jgi:hypothetical protein